jgi:hypothetical protein
VDNVDTVGDDGGDGTDADPRLEAVAGARGAPHVTGAPTSRAAAGVDPLAAPLTYPGTPPWRPAIVVTDTAVLVLEPRGDASPGEWLLHADAETDERTVTGPRGMPLDDYLRDTDSLPMTSLTPVLAVGSNASPAQLRRKLGNAGLPTLVPVTGVTVRGLAVGVSAHVSRPGYLPATPVPGVGVESSLWVLWLDDASLTCIDATEPNYQRVRLPARYPVRLTAGQAVPGCWVYRSRHGYLVNEAGEPRRLTDQPTLISALLAEIPALPALAGTSPHEWVERTRDATVRDAIREVFRSSRLVRQVGEL